MALKLTPEMLAAAYDFLRSTEPFQKWKLPKSHAVKFKVVADPTMFADFGVESGKPVIRVSAARNGHCITILETLAHEMCHLRQHLTGDRGHHTRAFKRMAARVCRAHGFDLKTF